MNRVECLVVALVVTLAPPALAGSDDRLELAEAIELAVQSHPGIASVEAEVTRLRWSAAATVRLPR